MNEKATRMLFATVALSAFAAVLVSSANARLPEGAVVPAEIYAASTSPTVLNTQETQQASLALDPAIASAIAAAKAKARLAAIPMVIPYLSQGVGVDKSLFAGLQSRTVAAQKRVVRAKTAPLPHGVQVGLP
jgi:hypothetical protein